VLNTRKSSLSFILYHGRRKKGLIGSESLKERTNRCAYRQSFRMMILQWFFAMLYIILPHAQLSQHATRAWSCP